MQWSTVCSTPLPKGESLFGCLPFDCARLLLLLCKDWWSLLGLTVADLYDIIGEDEVFLARSILAEGAIGYASIAFLEWMVACGFDARKFVMSIAIEERRYDVLEWLKTREVDRVEIDRNFVAAIRNRDISVLTWLRTKWGSFASRQPFVVAGEVGDTDVIDWLCEFYPASITGHMIEGAIRARNNDTLDYCCRIKSLWPPLSCTEEAARQGNIAMLWSFYGIFSPNEWAQTVYQAAIEGGQRETLQWLQRNSETFGWIQAGWYTAAARGGHLWLLQWLHLHEDTFRHDRLSLVIWNESTMLAAVRRDDLDMVRYLRNDLVPALRCPWSLETTREAARYGAFTTLKWLCTRRPEIDFPDDVVHAASSSDMGRCPCDEQICVMAAERGDMSMLRWAIDNGCPLHVDVCAAAARVGRFSVLKWLRALEPPCPWNRQQMLDAALRGENERIIEWLSHQPFSDDL